MYNGTTATSSNTDSFGRAEGTVLRGVHQVGDTLHSTIDRVTDPVKGVVERASTTAHEAVDRVAAGVYSAAGKADQQAQRVREMPQQAADQCRTYVRARPLRAVGAALALGWLIGRLGA